MSEHNPFSVIVDFEGDIETMVNEPIGEILPILPLKGMLLFPASLATVVIRRESSRKLIDSCKKTHSVFGVVTQKDDSVDSPTIKDLYTTGVVARAVKLIEMPDGADAVILQAYGRFELEEITSRRGFIHGRVHTLKDIVPNEDDTEWQAAVSTCRDDLSEYLQLMGNLPSEMVHTIRGIGNSAFLINFVATNLPFSMEEKYEMLKISDMKRRSLELLRLLNRELQYLRLKQDIAKNAREELDKQQREYFLQQQVKNIQEELGDGAAAEAKNFAEQLGKITNMDNSTREMLVKEIGKLTTLNPHHPDYGIQLEYLNRVFALPWDALSVDNLNVNHAEHQLDKDHFGLERVKERIAEQVALMNLKHTSNSTSKSHMPILCLVGPPGVGKTSLGHSIADALGRKYVRISLAGMHDESEIRGHRRTYVASMPGRIMKQLQKAGTRNPVFVLDEIDKVTNGGASGGDPQAALLELLDPEQNVAFHDNYFDFDFDLSNVLFVATANTLQGLPAPLLDRMEIIEIEGYLTEEKKEIAKRHLIPRLLRDTQIGSVCDVRIGMPAIEYIIEKYTRESGVRQLDKQLGKLVRKIAYKVTKDAKETEKSVLKVTPKDIEAYLGVPPYNRDKYEGRGEVGVVTGLAWTSVGGEILYIETSISKSKTPKFTLTGNLGDVMKESAMLGLEYVRAHATELGLTEKDFEEQSIHVHVPEGATPKDGPSAGITMATCIASALTHRRVRKAIAMTGEITLRGKVLPVGGIKEKILAAKRAGITDIIICKDNRRNVEDIPQQYVSGVTFHYVQTVSDVWKIALT